MRGLLLKIMASLDYYRRLIDQPLSTGHDELCLVLFLYSVGAIHELPLQFRLL